jgi:2-amino-4-hydroxy-6-hydroxymethyldihydropteridine diphosphokinase
LKYLLSLGSNIGDRLNYLSSACSTLALKADQIQVSQVYQTASWGIQGQPSYLNCALFLKSSLTPTRLLEFLLETEQKFGRVRQSNSKWQPRTLDIDLILAGSTILNSAHLQIPHPHFSNRRFVLLPASDICPDMIDPVTGHSIKELLDLCGDDSEIQPYEQSIQLHSH